MTNKPWKWVKGLTKRYRLQSFQTPNIFDIMLIVFIYGRDNKTLIIYDWNEIEFRWILFDGNEDHAYTNIVNLFTRYKRVFHMTKTKLVIRQEIAEPWKRVHGQWTYDRWDPRNIMHLHIQGENNPGFQASEIGNLYI